MVRCRELCPWLLVALLGISLLTPTTALGGRDRGNGSTWAPAKAKPQPAPAKVEADPPLLEPDQVSPSNLAKELDSKGQVDPVAGLGIRNPVCDQLGQIRDRATRLSCEANGSPESTYPTTNYGFDVFIKTGITHPVGSFTASFVTILNGIWLGLIFVLKLTLELLGLAFGLNPFSEGQTMGRISASVGRVYDQVTDPWLTTLVVCGGIWLAYRGLLQRDLAGGVGGTLAAVAMIVVGLWVVHQPRDSVGRLVTLSNEVALGTISAPRSGSLHRPVGSYAEAMSDTWARLVEVPFAGLNFSDVGWALDSPPPEAIERADALFCQDVGALELIATYQRLGSEKATEECAAFARKRYGKPRRVIDLYLRSSPGSPARAGLWKYFDKDEDDRYKAKVAAQGGDGALTRLSMLALFAIGLLGAILLLAWLSIRLFTQAAIAFVLLLAAPFALFFPLLGDGGRRAFKTWGLTLFGSLVAKVIYAAFLSIVLLGISILGRLEGSGGSATGFLLSSAFCWSIFLKRADLIGWLTIGEGQRGSASGSPLGRLAAYGVGRKLSSGLGGSVKGVARRGAEWQRERREVGSEATRATAKESLRSSARALADQRFREARQTVSSFEEHSSRTSHGSSERDQGAREERADRPGAAKPQEARSSLRGRAEAPPSREQYERAQGLLERSERNERRTGERWSAAELKRFAKEGRELLERSREPADHAHRAGYERAAFESLRGGERERAEVEIEKARRRDLKRLAAVERPPGRIAGRASIAAERARQGAEGAAPERRERLRALRRERRSGDHLARRRNLSRGA